MNIRNVLLWVECRHRPLRHWQMESSMQSGTTIVTVCVSSRTIIRNLKNTKCKLETKASPRRQDITTHIMRVELITRPISIYSNHTKYLAQPCGRFFCVLENFRRKFANLVAQPTDGTTKRLVRCNAYPIF